MTTFREHFNSVTFLQPAHFKTSAFFFFLSFYEAGEGTENCCP